jgi:hypothetical protein
MLVTQQKGTRSSAFGKLQKIFWMVIGRGGNPQTPISDNAAVQRRNLPRCFPHLGSEDKAK